MRSSAVSLSLAAALVSACGASPSTTITAASLAPPALPAAAAAEAVAGGIAGTVAEKIDASEYTYLRIKTASGEVWAAVPKSGKAVGDRVSIASPMWMKDFKSTALGRTFPSVAFGSLDDAGAAGPMGALPAPAKASPGAMGSAGAMASPHGGQPAQPVGDVKVDRAPGGKTVGEVYAQKAALQGKPVAVRGKVVKATDGVMGKTWLHLRDGSGEGATADLTVTSAESARVGDVVVASGVVRIDRDLGSGYRFDVLVEDAKIVKE